MKTKTYTSYLEIERELEILQLEREISYQKMSLSVHKIKEKLTPKEVVSEFLGSYKSTFLNSFVPILNIVVPLVIKWFINRKRGN